LKHSIKGIGSGNLDFYREGESLDAISSEEDDSNYPSKFLDENHSENERAQIKKLVSEFPDPMQYLIGFTCNSSLD